MKAKKFLVVLVGMLFLITAAGAILQADDTKTDNVENLETLNKKISFSQPKIIEKEEYTSIKLDDTEASTVGIEGKPLLPVKKMVYEFPMGTKIENVKLSYSGVETKTVEKHIEIVPEPQPYVTTTSKSKTTNTNQKSTGYDYQGFYPEKWHEYSVNIGLNENNERTTFVTVNVYPVRYSASDKTVKYLQNIDLNVVYDNTNTFKTADDTYDLLIISGSAYINELERLVSHKENRGIKTNLVSVDDISGQGRDLAEKIKYYIKEQIEETGIEYVMLVGGHRSFFGFDKSSLQIPTRFVHLDDGAEPGYVSDLYYADIYSYDEDTETYEFASWDTNNNEKYGEWYGYKIDQVDLYPDVHLGRLACRKTSEATTMVNKIINYENSESKNWFEKMYVLSGDDFQDQPKLDIKWDTTGLDGEFTIHAQSTNEKMETGQENTVTVTVDHSKSSSVTFSEEDHITTGLSYPHPPVAEITVPSEGNILGSEDVYESSPPGSYLGERWTPIVYRSKVMHIMGKSYNPQPQPTEGVNTTIEVWVTDSSGTTVFGPVEKQSNVWMEGEWATQKALDYMPNSFEKIKLWTSKGTFHGTPSDPVYGVVDVVNHLSSGAGFVYVAGHASPLVWADHYPGIPGGRHNSDITGLMSIDISHGLIPSLPLNDMTNGEKLPIMALSGCHPLQLDVSFMNLLTDTQNALYQSTWVFESLGWWLTRLEGGGTIATLGPAGLGYGYIGAYGTEGLGGWLWPEFFRQYSQEGKDILGETFSQTLNSYINTFGPRMDQSDTKTVEEMILLGDPTLQIG